MMEIKKGRSREILPLPRNLLDMQTLQVDAMYGLVY